MKQFLLCLIVLSAVTFFVTDFAYAQYTSTLNDKIFVFVQTTLRNSDGQLITYLESNKFTHLNLQATNSLLDFKDNEITAKISDPLDYEILSKSFDKGSIEERFEIASEGTYKLIIENLSPEDIQIMGVIGYMPDKGTLSVGIIGFFILIVGLVGIVGVGIYVIRTKRKEKFN